MKRKQKQGIMPLKHSKWLGLIEILQNDLNLNVYPGGYSGMTNWYHQHNIRFTYEDSQESLYGSDVDKIPKELVEDTKWERKFRATKFNYFPNDLGMIDVSTQGYFIKIPSLERALLEMTYKIGVLYMPEDLENYYGDLIGQIDAKNFQILLENCTSEKIKRIALFLLYEEGYRHFIKLDTSKIPLNLEFNREYNFDMIQTNHITKYNIQMSPDLVQPDNKHELCSAGSIIRERAI